MKTLVKKSTGVYQARIRINPKDKITYKSMRTKDPVVAQKRIDELYQQMERESAGIITSKKMRESAEMFLGELIRKYVRTLEAGQRYINATESRLKLLCTACEWKRIRDIDSLSFIEWRASQADYTPKTKNHYLSSLNAFCTWMVENGLALENPVKHVKPVKVRGRHAFKYRALNDSELSSLLKNSKRREIYLFAVLTGLRHSECGSVRCSDVNLNTDLPFVHVPADKTKNGKDADIKLHPDLVSWLRENLDARRMANEYLFPCMPDNRTVKTDFEKCGIVTANERGEKASFHSLRKTFCTLLHKSGVPQRIAQEAMRHGSPELTNDIYADRNLLAVGSAIDSLPSLWGGTKQAQQQGEKAMGGTHTGNAVNQGNAEALQCFQGEKENGEPILSALRTLKEWCTRMESNHHAVAGTRT